MPSDERHAHDQTQKWTEGIVEIRTLTSTTRAKVDDREIVPGWILLKHVGEKLGRQRRRRLGLEKEELMFPLRRQHRLAPPSEEAGEPARLGMSSGSALQG
jgi:hypothetical protein